MTVMNDRPQGGSAWKNGRIELMVNRRMYYDDDRGVGEALNERYANGDGIMVPATFHVQVFNYNKTESWMRAR
jgi:hypothetical protein